MISSTLSVLILVLIFSVNDIQAYRKRSSDAMCSSTEIQVDCAPLLRCQPTCENPQGMPCPRICSRYPCVCKEGLLRDGNNSLICIDASRCPLLTKAAPECGENEEPNECVNPCQPSCQSPNRKPCPTLQCLSGCVCKDGYRRANNNVTSLCIKCEEIIIEP
ncbi:unnamed protein product [Rotaria sordida]|uniref:TIL domain-containing protein n=1 Tax=Rotaria sordida TaxID=392033 RepID=A0A815ZLH0_9BILA|nr:unnamed protein product [Rotaria sordida]